MDVATVRWLASPQGWSALRGLPPYDPATELAEGRLATTLGNRSLLDSSAHFRAMREHHRAAVMTPYGRTG